MILDPGSGHCGGACASCCYRWISVHLTINRERRLHRCGLHQVREEGAGSHPASSAAFCALCSQATFGFPLQGVTSLACFFGPLDGRIAVKHDRAQKFIRRLLREDVCIAKCSASLRCALAGRAYASAPFTPNTMK